MYCDFKVAQIAKMKSSKIEWYVDNPTPYEPVTCTIVLPKANL
jgi:hypothetical protein